MAKAGVKKKAQSSFEGMDDMGIEAIDNAAALLLEVEDRKKAVAKEEKAANNAVVKVMEENERTSYIHDSIVVDIDSARRRRK